MGFGTQVDQDDFKVTVEKFAEEIKEVDEELESQVKSSQAKVAELFESVCLQNVMYLAWMTSLFPELTLYQIHHQLQEFVLLQYLLF